jgi:hypothetical protein
LERLDGMGRNKWTDCVGTSGRIERNRHYGMELLAWSDRRTTSWAKATYNFTPVPKHALWISKEHLQVL